MDFDTGFDDFGELPREVCREQVLLATCPCAPLNRGRLSGDRELLGLGAEDQVAPILRETHEQEATPSPTTKTAPAFTSNASESEATPVNRCCQRHPTPVSLGDRSERKPWWHLGGSLRWSCEREFGASLSDKLPRLPGCPPRLHRPSAGSCGRLRSGVCRTRTREPL